MNKVALKKRPAKKEYMQESIIIDEKRGLVFSSEEELYDHFLPQTQKLEKEFFLARKNSDIPEQDFEQYEALLSHVLNDPDEIWLDTEKLKNYDLHTYVGHYLVQDEAVYYIALTLRVADEPNFIFLHFPTKDEELVEKYRNSELVYDRVLKEVELGSIEGDALSEGDDLAVGLYRAMMKVRSSHDVPEEKFKAYEQHREDCIEDADEIWRNTDLSGNILVSFIKDFGDEDQKDLKYIVVTIEDPASSSHALLFSFPTIDENLVDRYRHGENLQAEEVVQEASH